MVTPGGWGGKTLGPPIFSDSNPLALSTGIADQFGLEPDARTAWPAVDFRGSFATSSASPAMLADTWRWSRSGGASLQRPVLLTNSTASQSSSSGWVGGVP